MELPEGVQAITLLNQERGAEMIDLVSSFVDSDDNAPELDEIYEEAVKFIDKVPYKKGTEQIQTNKAYADQKPTNDKLRVSSDQLDKFVSEVVGDLEDDMLPPDFKMPNISTTDDGSKGIDPLDEPIDFDDSEPVEAVSPEKAALINQAYDNLVAAGNQAPTTDDILREVDKIKGVTPSVEKTRAIPKGAEEFYEGEELSHVVKDINSDDVVAQGFNNLLPDEHKTKIIQMADEILSNKLGVKKFQMGKEKYLELVKGFAMEIYQRGVAQMNEEAEKGEYPDQMGKKFKPKNQMPKKKKRPQAVVKLTEEEDPVSPEKVGPEWTEKKSAEAGEETGNQVPGGLADEKDPVDFNSQQIMIGMGIEMEHTDDPKVALEIAMDHLMEIPDYYTRLDKMEKEAEAGAEGGEVETSEKGVGDEDSETTDELLGFKPHNVGDYVTEEMYANDVDGNWGDDDNDENYYGMEDEDKPVWYVMSSGNNDLDIVHNDKLDDTTMSFEAGPMTRRDADDAMMNIGNEIAHGNDMGQDDEYFDRAGDPLYEETSGLSKELQKEINYLISDIETNYETRNSNVITDALYDDYGYKDKVDYNTLLSFIKKSQADAKQAGIESGDYVVGGRNMNAPEDTGVGERPNFNQHGEFTGLSEEEADLNDYQGEIGDRYQDGKGNQLTVKDTDDVDNAVTLQSNDGDKEIATQDIQYLKALEEENGAGKYSTVEKTKYGMTYLFAFPDPSGIETEEGLNGWESQDPANRELYFVDSREAAVGGLESFQESKKKKPVITEEMIQKARRTLNKRGLNEGMTKKEAVQILIKHNIR